MTQMLVASMSEEICEAIKMDQYRKKISHKNIIYSLEMYKFLLSTRNILQKTSTFVTPNNICNLTLGDVLS